MDPRLEQQADAVLGLVCRAQHVFGAPTAAVEPPDFAADRHIEDHLGRGYF